MAQRIAISVGVTTVPWGTLAVAIGWRDALTVARALRRTGLRVACRPVYAGDAGCARDSDGCPIGGAP